mmetsp:Transcript_29951/g.74973  ORF Transcript_29951/g.74973 Transcript_29951/m.74973 type:complete len:108 (+) Transcript_29951:475-798(+)
MAPVTRSRAPFTARTAMLSRGLDGDGNGGGEGAGADDSVGDNAGGNAGEVDKARTVRFLPGLFGSSSPSPSLGVTAVLLPSAVLAPAVPTPVTTGVTLPSLVALPVL